MVAARPHHRVRHRVGSRRAELPAALPRLGGERVRSDGNGLGLIAQSARAPAWSPKGTRLAYDTGVEVVDYDDARSVTIAHPDGSSAVLVPAVRNSSLIGPVWIDLPRQRGRAAQASCGHRSRPDLVAGRAAARIRRRLQARHHHPERQGRRRLSPKRDFVVAAAWSPKSGTIAYVAGTKRDPYAYLPRNLRIETVSSDGKHVRVLAREPYLFVDEPPVWTADGRRILVAAG